VGAFFGAESPVISVRHVALAGASCFRSLLRAFRPLIVPSRPAALPLSYENIETCPVLVNFWKISAFKCLHNVWV
jgi:hypothetical protein